MNILKGKTMVVTGANTGIGRVTAEKLAAQGAHVVLACRDLGRTQPVLDAIARAGGQASFVALDLADLDAVRVAAEKVARHGPIHALINNAGLANVPGVTKQGFEMTFGVNHLGPYLFTALLWPNILAGAPSRVINVASRAHTRIKTFPWEQFQGVHTSPGGFQQYCYSKLANVLFTRGLARRVKPDVVATACLHPGGVATEVFRNQTWLVRTITGWFTMTPEQGATSTLATATMPREQLQHGAYYNEHAKVTPMNPLALDDALVEELWKKSAAWTGVPEDWAGRP
jgi:retinol dehydrogenase-12